MRHLKTFEHARKGVVPKSETRWWQLATVPVEIQKEIADICLDLKDDGFIISYQLWPPFDRKSRFYNNNKYPYISICKPLDGIFGRTFQYSEISETVERLRSYLNSVGFNINVRQQTASDIIQLIDRSIYGDVFE